MYVAVAQVAVETVNPCLDSLQSDDWNIENKKKNLSVDKKKRNGKDMEYVLFFGFSEGHFLLETSKSELGVLEI